jgi:hypothetical protein
MSFFRMSVAIKMGSGNEPLSNARILARSPQICHRERDKHSSYTQKRQACCGGFDRQAYRKFPFGFPQRFDAVVMWHSSVEFISQNPPSFLFLVVAHVG